MSPETKIGSCDPAFIDLDPLAIYSQESHPAAMTAAAAVDIFPNSQYRSTDLFQEPRQILLYGLIWV